MFNTTWIRSSNISGNTEVGHGSIVTGEIYDMAPYQKQAVKSHTLLYQHFQSLGEQSDGIVSYCSASVEDCRR